MKRKCERRVKPLLCSGEYFHVIFKYTFMPNLCLCSLQILECLLGSHLGPPRRRTSAEEEERVNNPTPEV